MSSPRATYRLQLTAGFGFDAARALVPYLRDLGVSHIYLSPIMTARSGSTHGYDVVDPTRVSEELGGDAALRALSTQARAAGMELLVDFVPNHMAIDDANPYWRDERRRQRFFDIDPQTGWHRRFFTIDDLAGVRVEDPEVFAETHAKILELLAQGVVGALRIDHPDGLADPAGYLRRLRDAGARRVWVEKILEPGEELRDWPVEGTTGYEFASDATALFVDPAGERALTELYQDFTGDRESYAASRDAAKLERALGEFGPELAELTRLLPHPRLAEAVASLPVYRTYVEPGCGRIEDADRQALGAVPADLRRVLELEERGHDPFVTRFQQTTGPVMAKGVEDTVFYRYLRLLALNEVGGDPSRFSLSVARFHELSAARLERFPHCLLASQTHDTKRSGDVRARLAALAGIADEWAARVRDWHELGRALSHGPGPDRLEEYLIFQTLIGAWPLSPERLCAYLEKALREAGRNSGWREPNSVYESSVLDFAVALIGDPRFRASFDPLAERVAAIGERHALAALALRLCSPGVPDIYQGDELWSLNLVDPDNRRPVDWELRRAALAALAAGEAPGRETLKLALIRAALVLRARRAAAFDGAYTPLDAPPEVCAFTRGEHEVCAIVAVREGAALDAVAPPAVGRWSEVFACASVRLLERSGHD